MVIMSHMLIGDPARVDPPPPIGMLCFVMCFKMSRSFSRSHVPHYG